MEMVFVGIGSNMDREQNIRIGIAKIRERFGMISLSPVYESRAVGFEGENFYNLVVGFSTELAPKQLVTELHEIESLCKRVRTGPCVGSRSLDLDLLMYGDLIQQAGRFQLPREEITRYAFVLKPLADIAANIMHPVLGISMAELWIKFCDPEQSIWPVQFNPL